MANLKISREQNEKGDFFVDTTCIDCGTCYWMAQDVFKRNTGMSCVYKQPTNGNSEDAMRALFSCPTNSIGYLGENKELKKLASSFPIHIVDNIFHTGFHSENSYGATSYFIKREQGNILIDSPKYTGLLSRKFEDHGGVKLQYLTHKDDIADTDLYQKDFNSKRLMHLEDITVKTKHYEIQLKGEEDYRIDEDLLVISVPGHTKGHTVLLYKEKYLFTGDHLSFSYDLGHLYAFKNACWYDFEIQIKSMKKLFNYKFLHVLPGHGAPFRGESYSEMNEQLVKCIKWMENA